MPDFFSAENMGAGTRIVQGNYALLLKAMGRTEAEIHEAFDALQAGDD